MKNKKILITGSSGFIGFHLSNFLLQKNFNIIGIDNHDDYYDIKIKNQRLKILRKNNKFIFFKLNILDKNIHNIFKKYKPDLIINLAAQAGVRFSLKNPQKYIDTNIKGFLNILEAMKSNNLKKIIYASSSSVYGNTKKFPTTEKTSLAPENIYGITKMFNEELAKFYKEKFNIKSIGLRFFTVYGKLGRPDMFIPKVIKNMKENRKINLYNHGRHHRDFTYVDDINKAIYEITRKMLTTKAFKNDVYNICKGKTVKIYDVINEVSKYIKKKPRIVNKVFQLGDMYKTHGSNKKLSNDYKYKDLTNLSEGIYKIFNE